MRKRAARYASQPTIDIQNPTPGMPGLAGNNQFSALFPFGPGTNLQQASAAARNNPNPVANPSVPQPGTATPEGVQQAMMKGSEAQFDGYLSRSGGLPALGRALGLSVDVTKVAGLDVSQGSSSWKEALGRSKRGSWLDLEMILRNRKLIRADDGHTNIEGKKVCQASDANESKGDTEKVWRSGNADMCPQCGKKYKFTCRCRIGHKHCENGHNWYTCPVHKDRIILGTGHGTGLGFGCHCGSGADGQNGSFSSNLSKPAYEKYSEAFPPSQPPMMPPAQPQMMPPMQPQMMPPGQPPMPPPPPSQIDPATGQPVTPPMGTPPTPPLPSNPRPNPPHPKTSDQALQEATWLQLLEQKQQADDPLNETEATDDINDQLMGMGGKSAAEYVSPDGKLTDAGRDLYRDTSSADSIVNMGINGGVRSSAIGALLGTLLGVRRGNVSEGLGRGILRGGATGIGAGIGTGIGAGIASRVSDPYLAAGLTMGGTGLGALTGYGLSGKVLGKPVGISRRANGAYAGGPDGEEKEANFKSVFEKLAEPPMQKNAVFGKAWGRFGPGLDAQPKAIPMDANGVVRPEPNTPPGRNEMLSQVSNNRMRNAPWYAPRIAQSPVMQNPFVPPGMGFMRYAMDKFAEDITYTDPKTGKKVVADHEQLGKKLAEQLMHAARGNRESELLHNAMLDHLRKFAAQACDGKASPARSATGESQGLTFSHKEDNYAQGQEAWEATSKYFKGGKKSKPNPFLGKHANVLQEYRKPLPQNKTASASLEKAAYWPAIRPALSNAAAWGRQFFGRNARNIVVPKPGATGAVAAAESAAAPSAAQGVHGMMPNAVQSVAPSAAASAAAAAPSAAVPPSAWESLNSHMRSHYGGSVGQHVGHSALWGGLGGLTGADDPNAVAVNTGLLGTMHWNPYQGAMSAAMWNPALGANSRKMTQGWRGAATIPVMGYRGHQLGGMAGGGVDAALNYGLGYDTNGQFRQLGSLIGATSGVGMRAGHWAMNTGARGAPRALTAQIDPITGKHVLRSIDPSTMRIVGHRLKHMADAPFKGVNNFAQGVFSPVTDTFNAGGRFVSKTFNRMRGVAPPVFNAAKRTPSLSEQAGRVVGWGGAGLAGGFGALNLAGNVIDNKVGKVYENMRPVVERDMQMAANNYLAQLGILGDDGSLNLGGAVPGLGTLANSADGIFQAIGMDPSRMSAMQKMMILGGLGVGGAGLMSGSGTMATMGGGAALAGLLPLLMQNRKQEAGQRPPGIPETAAAPRNVNVPTDRNEYLHQLQMQQQSIQQ